VVSLTLRPLYSQGKSRWYPLDRKMGGPQCRSGYGIEKKNSQPLPALEPPIIEPVARLPLQSVSTLHVFKRCYASSYFTIL